ncbi:hypothetical protein SAMN05421848_1222 [Kushneria avicenniae]|uniref:Lipid A deacylase LpxR family protein n=1 Tax=Kushneria avicenniae TaxID=402385 RepID=A0A1I1IHA4_9GAMM|nr:lipid A deacylase LpxR family protein [Kushneria avicenniae]SFC35341.1 hypothetical protein SAMN05421848_1222 [Kushneria avicenniae]
MIRCAILVGSSLLFSASAMADGVLTFKFTNDFLAARSDDGHYTNGLEGSWSFEPEGNHWTRSVASWIPGWAAGDVDAASYRFGQQMYTPEDTKRRDLITDDRPYAGYLYGGLSLYRHNMTPKWRIDDAFSLDVGLVGPGSGAKAVQKNFHHLVDSDDPRGWHNQLHNEPTVTLAMQRSWWYRDSLGSLALEYGPNAGFALGNLYDYASAGLGIRLGRRLDDLYTTPSMAPYTSSDMMFSRDRAFNWYLFGNVQGRFVAHNMLLDGNTFEDSHSVDKRQWVGDLEIGGAISWDRYNLSLITLKRSREFEQQDGDDYFGVVTLSSWL